MTDPRWSCIASPSRTNKLGHRTNRQGIRMNRPVPLRVKTRTCVHNDYEDLL